MALTDILIRRIISAIGFSKESVDKIESMIDNISINKHDDGKTTIEIKLNKITITIDNN